MKKPNLLIRLANLIGRCFKRAPKKQTIPQDVTAQEDQTMHNHNDGLVPYDENLLERARTQWQFGDWESLIKIERETLQHHPDRAKLALLAAAGHLQQGDNNTARQFTRLAQEWGCSKKLLSQILIAGVHNSLGRASAINGDGQRALEHFESAIASGSPAGEVRLLTTARLGEQMEQMGLAKGTLDIRSISPATLNGNVGLRKDATQPTRLSISKFLRQKNSTVRLISKILVTGDILRPTSDGDLCQSSNINWLYALIGTQIQSALGQESQQTKLKIKVYSGDVTESRQIYDLFELCFVEDSWAQIYNRYLPESIKQILTKSLCLEPNMVIIGFELSPTIKNFLSEKSISYIDIRISPYRYLDDLLLNFSSNDDDIITSLAKYKVDNHMLFSAANLEKHKRRNASIDIAPGAMVFFGQTPKDASLINLEEFDSYKNYLKEILYQKTIHASCFYKPHPHARDEEAISFFENIGFNLTNSNVYDLLSSNKLETVIGLNSSVLNEAVYFGKNVVKLRCIDIYDDSYSIYNSFLSSEFWNDIFNLNKVSSHLKFENRPNLLRESLGQFWGK